MSLGFYLENGPDFVSLSAESFGQTLDWTAVCYEWNVVVERAQARARNFGLFSGPYLINQKPEPDSGQKSKKPEKPEHQNQKPESGQS